MAKKPSKAPKERINITYRSAIRPSETIELPFKMLVLADVSGLSAGLSPGGRAGLVLLCTM